MRWKSNTTEKVAFDSIDYVCFECTHYPHCSSILLSLWAQLGERERVEVG